MSREWLLISAFMLAALTWAMAAGAALMNDRWGSSTFYFLIAVSWQACAVLEAMQ